MKIIDDPKYDREYPEQYAWGRIDSRSGSELGHVMAAATLAGLMFPIDKRFEVSGLRRALNILAAYYDEGG